MTEVAERAVRTARLVGRRARARVGLLVALAGTIAVAVAVVLALAAGLAVAATGAPRPAGMSGGAYADEVARGAAALGRVAPGLVLAVALVAVVAVIQLARLLQVARTAEDTFARARGLGARDATALAAIEGALVLAAGGAAGVAAGAALAFAVAPALGSPARVPAALPDAAAVALAVAVVLAACVVAVGARRPRPAGRVVRAASVVLLVAVILAAVFVTWRARTVAGDPVAALAPPVLVTVGALAVLAVSAPLLRAAAALAARGAGVVLPLATAGAARRLTVSGVAIVLVAFAAAQAGFGAVFAATAERGAVVAATVRAGADLRVDLGDDAATPALAADVADVPGVDTVAAGLVTELESGSASFPLVALPGDRIADVVAAVPGAVDPVALADVVAAGGERPEIPAGVRMLRIAATAQTSARGGVDLLELSAFVADSAGATQRVRFATTSQPDGAGDVALTGEAPLPDGPGPWRVVGVVAQLRASAAPPTVAVSLTALEAVGAGALAGVTGVAQVDRAAPSAALWGAGAADARVPAVFSRALADRLGLRAGDVVDARFAGAGRSLSLTVTEVVPAVPGAGGSLAVLADADAVTAVTLAADGSVPAANTLWAAGDVAAAASVSAAVGDRPVRTAAPGVADTVAAAARPAWALAIGGGTVLALIALIAATRALAVARRGEAVALRGLGAPPAVQARMRGLELALTSGFALVGGAAAGLLAALLVAAPLAAPDADGIGALAVDGGLLAVSLGALAVGVAVVVAGAAAGAARTARTATARDLTA